MSGTYKTTRDEWENLPLQPSAEELGYEDCKIDIIKAGNEYLFLPQDEELLREDAYLIAKNDAAVKDLTDCF